MARTDEYRTRFRALQQQFFQLLEDMEADTRPEKQAPKAARPRRDPYQRYRMMEITGRVTKPAHLKTGKS